MDQRYEPGSNALVAVDDGGQARSILYSDRPFTGRARSPQALAFECLRNEAKRYGLSDEQLRNIAKRPDDRLTDAGVEYRLESTKRIMDVTTFDLVQTILGVTVWRAGIALQVKDQPLGVLGSTFTGVTDLAPERPDADRVRRMLEIDPAALAKLLRLGEREDELEKGRWLPPKINGTRLRVYRYRAKERVPGPGRRDSPSGHHPSLPLAPVPEAIREGRDYVVVQVFFSLTIRPGGSLHWTALIEPESESVLYLRALVDGLQGLVYPNDPVALSGNPANGPAANTATLDALRQSVTLLGLDPPTAGVQALSGEYVRVQDAYVPSIAPPTQPTAVDFDYGSRTDAFAAVSAYHHSDYCFRLVAGMGFAPGSYFDGTTFPVPVDHRGSADLDGIFGGPTDNDGDQVNAQSLGNATGTGQGLLNFFLADTTDLANPLGIACDRRVVLHEFGHTILWDHVHWPNFGFAHSAGDSLAAVLCDPDSLAPDRFETFPFTFQSLPANARRRHDRDVAAGWAWGGTQEDGGYDSEQILSTTMFRFYRSIGGDHANVTRRRLAARIAAYLMVRAVGTLTPASNAPNAVDFANALMLADAGEWTSEGLAGGAYHKVIRWAFEKQGLYQASGAPAPVTAPGAPPAVDVYIDDGRGGEYPFQPNHWSTTDIWNRTSVGDGGGVHQHPVVGVTNYAYVRIKNRGTATATNIVVRGFHCLPGVGLVYPNDWQSMTTNQLVAANLASGASAVIGPFEWTPSQLDHECMFFSVSALGDASNIDGRITGAIPEWRLVPNDNNIGQRNVTPVPAGGGLRALVEAFAGRRFWVRNSLESRARIQFDVKLPEFLAARGWRLVITSPGGDEFTLAAGERKEITVRMDPGRGFEPRDVKSGDEHIDIAVQADGIVLGGMRYTLDPELRELVRAPSGSDSTACRHGAKGLLACLGLERHEVRDVRLRKVTIDVHLDDPGC